MCDVLVRSHNNNATPVSIDASHLENVLAASKVGTEDLFIVAQPIPTLPGQKQRGHGLNGKCAMALLEDGADIDYRVDIGPLGRVSPNRRLRGFGKKVAQRAQLGGVIFGSGKSDTRPDSICFQCVTQGASVWHPPRRMTGAE